MGRGGGGVCVRKSLSSADTMENWSGTLIMHDVDQEKSISLDGVGSCERPEEFPIFIATEQVSC